VIVVALAVAMVVMNVKMDLKTRSGKREESTTRGGVKRREREKGSAVLYPF
jgi:hypothetical protein